MAKSPWDPNASLFVKFLKQFTVQRAMGVAISGLLSVLVTVMADFEGNGDVIWVIMLLVSLAVLVALAVLAHNQKITDEWSSDAVQVAPKSETK